MTRHKRWPRLKSLDHSESAEQEMGTPVKFLFVGERPSLRAEKIGATLQNGKLSGKTLQEALCSLNLDPDAHHYLNLYEHSRSKEDIAFEEVACREILRLMKQGFVVVGLGRIVSTRLHARCIPHLRMIHPAARGAIRRRDRYQSHVGTVLLAEHRSADRRRTGGA